MSEVQPYYKDYPGYLSMLWHDQEEELKRWFANWAQDKYASFAADTEWLTIEETSWLVRGKRVTRYIGTVGADHHARQRVVKFEVGAPPPPTFMRPVRKKYEPPPPEPLAWAQRRAVELAYMDRMVSGYLWNHMLTPRQRFIAETLPPVAPPPPRYRRN